MCGSIVPSAAQILRAPRVSSVERSAGDHDRGTNRLAGDFDQFAGHTALGDRHSGTTSEMLVCQPTAL